MSGQPVETEDLTEEEKQQVLNRLTEAVAQDITSGRSKEKITKDIVKKWGWEQETAINFVENVDQALERARLEYQNSPEGKQALAKQYKKHMIYGALWFIGGVTVTIVTYTAASGGGTYIVAWGAVIWGLIDFFRGFANWQKYKS